MRSCGQPMKPRAVPQKSGQDWFRISIPAPDILFGYCGSEAFPGRGEATALRFMSADDRYANSNNLLNPFLVAEFNASSAKSGEQPLSFYAASNITVCIASSLYVYVYDSIVHSLVTEFHVAHGFAICFIFRHIYMSTYSRYVSLAPPKDNISPHTNFINPWGL